jgi:hypothetical protein
VLAPAGVPLEAETTDDGSGEDGTGDAAAEPAAAATGGSMTPASVGLSFAVDPKTTRLRVLSNWGHYQVGPSESGQLTDSGIPRQVWRRTAVVGETVIDITTAGRVAPDAERPKVLLRWQSRMRGGVRTIELSLVNVQDEPDSNRDVARLYQATLTVTAEDGQSAVFVAHNDPAASASPARIDPEQAGLDLLYRDCREYAIGRNVAVQSEERAAETRAWQLATVWIPSFDIPQTLAPPQISGLRDEMFDMSHLARVDRAGMTAGLRPLVTAYEQWLDGEEQRAQADATLTSHERSVRANLAAGRTAARRMAAGIDVLAEDDVAWQAWRFANEVMALQRLHTEVAALRDSDPELGVTAAVAQADTPSKRSWRPFQLAFLLLNLPALTDPGHPDRAEADAENGPGLVDLLFFPTGGGKTEAYLGLLAYTLAIRRLQGVVGAGAEARDGRAGVAVLMRYTLRLLTSQQYQRAATLICAAEQVRRSAVLAAERGESTNPWGEEPFRIGLWVGSHVTPNSYDVARDDIEKMRGRYADRPAYNPIQLLRCPWCARDLTPGQDVECDDTRRRTLIWCGDPDGECPFSRRQSSRWKEGLPVVTVDEEIFRLCPSLVIGTVDKFAQLPWRGYTGMLFGTVSSRCERHGYRRDDLEKWTDCRSSHPRRGEWPATQPQACLPLRPPDLVIQDELHLISGALGTMVALYETAVDRLASWRFGGRAVRPKVVASTATVRRAKEQVHGIFARDLAVFPLPILSAGETFFSRRAVVDAAYPGRRYLGVCAHGQRLKQVEVRVAQILLAAAQALFDAHGEAADPYMTLVDYFSSTTELAGMRRLVDDDIATRLRQQGRRGLGNRWALNVQELTSRISSQEIGSALGGLTRPFRVDIDTTAARQARGAARRGGTGDDLPRHAAGTEPVDIVLATSMLQVGVDIPRLGLMVVTGQPKNAAEYIQATSRIGRDGNRPGLVVTVYNWARPRDLNHYETFAQFHASAYARVEALSVTPFAARALDRGLVGVLVASIRHAREELQREAGAHIVTADDADVRSAVEWISSRAHELVDVDAAEEVRRRCRELLDLWDRKRRGLESGRLSYADSRAGLSPLMEARASHWSTWSVPWSLRDVDPEINLILDVVAPEVAERPSWRFTPTEPTTVIEGDDGDAPIEVDEMGSLTDSRAARRHD